MPRIVTNDTLAFDTAAKFNFLACVVDYFMRKNLQLLPSFV